VIDVQAFPYTADPTAYGRLLDLGVMSFATDHPDVALARDQGLLHSEEGGERSMSTPAPLRRWRARAEAVEPQSISCPRTIMSRSLKRTVIVWAPNGMTSVASSSTAMMDGTPSVCAGNTIVTSGMRG
jgi:hypothetical protein